MEKKCNGSFMLHLPKESNSGIKSAMSTQMSLAEIMFSFIYLDHSTGHSIQKNRTIVLERLLITTTR